MEAPCVRVSRERGEATRRRLAETDLIARDLDIAAEDGWLYIPVTDPGGVPAEFTIVDREVEPRETQTLPADALDFEPTYERLGELVLLYEDDVKRARTAAEAIMASDLPAETVLRRASKVKGETRVREWDVLAGDGTETIHREYGYEFVLDVTEVYFSPRLATERHRVVEQVEAGERVFDMFAGVGPFAVPIAGGGADVVATDLNDVAIAYLEENARRNGVDERITAIHGDVRRMAAEYQGWADRVVMNLPHTADAFLDVALELAGESCVLHYYDVQHEDDPFGPGEAAIRSAAGEAYGVSVETRREVRSYAPHEVNVCLDVRLERRSVDDA